MGLTGQGSYRLTVEYDHKGKPFLKLEPSGREKEILKDGYIALRLHDNTTFAEAQALADEMRKYITQAAIATGA
jgi:hypothetical protein